MSANADNDSSVEDTIGIPAKKRRLLKKNRVPAYGMNYLFHSATQMHFSVRESYIPLLHFLSAV